jgi:hypothetical protein
MTTTIRIWIAKMPRDDNYSFSVLRRSDGTRQNLRPVQQWPKGKPFRLLSIDGGGILGLLPCLILAELETRFLDGNPIGQHFDMIAGTSTGGIIAMGLAQGKSAKKISKLYLERGEHIFPGNRLQKWVRKYLQTLMHTHDRKRLENELRREFGDALLGSCKIPLCIPAFEGSYGEPYIFKTPHHPDYKRDQHKPLVNVGLATAAAPATFAAYKEGGYTFVDGGVWANNPTMVGLVDALSCYDIDRNQVRVLSLGCGQDIHRMSWWQRIGGFWHWRKHFASSVMRAQSHNALGQASLLIGRDHLIRLDAPDVEKRIAMDDVSRAIKEMPPVARSLTEGAGHRIAALFLDANINVAMGENEA